MRLTIVKRKGVVMPRDIQGWLIHAKAKAFDLDNNYHNSYDEYGGNKNMTTKCKNPNCLRTWNNKVEKPKKCPYCQHYNNKPPKGEDKPLPGHSKAA
jgi:hypothetical protein